MDDHGYTITSPDVFYAAVQGAVQRVHDRLDLKITFDKPLDQYQVGDKIFIPKFHWHAKIVALPEGDKPMRLAVDITYTVPFKIDINEWDAELAPGQPG